MPEGIPRTFRRAKGPEQVRASVARIAGFACATDWPLSGLMLAGLMPATWGWRGSISALRGRWTRGGPAVPATDGPEEPEPPRLALWLLACVFAANGFSPTAMAALCPLRRS